MMIEQSGGVFGTQRNPSVDADVVSEAPAFLRTPVKDSIYLI